MGLRGVWICSTRSDALLGSIGHDGSLSANHWRRGHIASEDHGWFRHRPLTAGLRKLGLIMPGCYASLSCFRMKFEALRAVGIFFSLPRGSPIMAFTSPAMMVESANHARCIPFTPWTRRPSNPGQGRCGGHQADRAEPWDVDQPTD